MNLRNCIVFFGIISLAILGCEGAFRAERGVDAKVLSGPSQMRVVSLNSKTYLAVLNSNLGYAVSNGSLQFFDITTATAPVRNTALDLLLPSNASDFLIDTDNTLYVADRDQSQILVFDFGTSFTPRLDASGNQVVIPVSENPQRLLMFTSAATNPDTASVYGKILAVLCESTGTIHFIKVSNLRMVPSTIKTDGTNDLQSVRGLVGAYFYMTPRQTVPDTDDYVNLNYGERTGFGINELASLGDANETLVTPSFISTGLFSYQFKTLQNAANVTWDFYDYKGDRLIDNVVYPGTGEYGFRGMTVDQAQNIYLSSRGDNEIYKVASSEVLTGKTDTTRNTFGYALDNLVSKISVTPDFHPVATDTNFPRLSRIVSDCPTSVVMNTAYTCTGGAGPAAHRLWVLGYGTNEIFRLDLTTAPAGLTTSKANTNVVLNAAQNILWYPALSGEVLYVANTGANTILVLNADALTYVTTINTSN